MTAPKSDTPPEGNANVEPTMIPVSAILDEIAHIKENGARVREFPGMEDEGRCRELCAMYLEEFIHSERLRLHIEALAAPSHPATPQESRSQLRRIAAQKGEPAPRFESSPEARELAEPQNAGLAIRLEEYAATLPSVVAHHVILDLRQAAALLRPDELQRNHTLERENMELREKLEAERKAREEADVAFAEVMEENEELEKLCIKLGEQRDELRTQLSAAKREAWEEAVQVALEWRDRKQAQEPLTNGSTENADHLMGQAFAANAIGRKLERLAQGEKKS